MIAVERTHAFKSIYTNPQSTVDSQLLDVGTKIFK